MESARAIADRFYTAMSRREAESMAALYAEDVTFSDPVFPELAGEMARDMWRMLCTRGKDLRIEHRVIDVTSDGTVVRTQVDAWYTFSATGRAVHNSIAARMTVRDGLIRTHRDEFDFHAWARQALGTPGLLLGWTPFLKRKVQKQAATALARYRAERSSAAN